MVGVAVNSNDLTAPMNRQDNASSQVTVLVHSAILEPQRDMQ
jgi:hypothetical protein